MPTQPAPTMTAAFGASATAQPCQSWSVDQATAHCLWDTLLRVRVDSRAIGGAEDALFRLYLPFARAVAATPTADPVDPELATEAAELGLATAILTWRRPHSAAFDAFARAAVESQIRRIPPAVRRRRSAGAPWHDKSEVGGTSPTCPD